ncbi:MAG: stage II sporulation protein R [Clostridia bacterium]|nr:stage II sporulation protein R [Clostridia bacterium]
MKKSGITFIFVLIIVLAVVLATLPVNETHAEYLRIHIRANGNSEEEQAVKYVVKDRVVDYLAPILAGCESKEKALKTLEDSLSGIESVCDKTLAEQGFSYKAKASVRKENFPTRTYDNLTLDGGIYDALIIELGSGKGDNWWCVAYPPLCFTQAKVSYIYKSKIYEIIKNFFGKKGG